MKFSYRIAGYLLVLLLLVFIRFTLDKEGIFISSDGEVKYYQSYGHFKDGLGQYECYYPGKEIDPDFEYYIFQYPFAFFKMFKNLKCVLQYPPLFAILGSFLIKMSGLKAALYLPLFFYFLCMLLFDFILRTLNVRGTVIFISAFLSFTIGIFPLSVLDYSEMSFYNLTVLIALLILSQIVDENERDRKDFKFLSFWLGFTAIFSFFVRSEVALLAVLIFIFLFIFYPDRWGVFKVVIYAAVGGMIPLAVFLFFNYISVEYPFGMRTFTVLNDTTERADFFYHLKIAKGFLWQDEEMIGIAKAFPGVFFGFLFFIPSFYKKLNLFSRLSIFTGILYIILAALSTPTKGGVHHFGLRYLETGLLPILLGITYGLDKTFGDWNEKKSPVLKTGIILFLLFSVYTGYGFVKEGVKLLVNNSKLYTEIMKDFEEVGESYVIHDSMNSAYLVGRSFLFQKHVYIGNDPKMQELEKQFVEMKVNKFMIISFEGEPYISINVPKNLYPRVFSKLNFKPVHYEKYREKKMLHFKLTYYQMK